MRVEQPDGTIMQATHTAKLAIDHLPDAVRHAYVFPEMQNKCLLALGTFCDNGYEIHLTISHIYITHLTDPALSLVGHRDLVSKMWTVNIDNNPNQTAARVQSTRLMANNVYEYKKKKDIVTYLHKAAFSPVKSTWLRAIQAGFYTTWPGLTPELVDKHLDKSTNIVKGHLRQIQQNLRSTSKPTQTPTSTPTPVMTIPSNEGVRANLVSAKMIEIEGKVFSD